VIILAGMARPVRSQWDFGELFPTEQTRRALSVTELTAQIRRLLEKDVGAVRVTGEITNLRVQGSGHIYFTLKDAGAQLSCVLFRGEVQVDRSVLQDGRKVVLNGEVTVYEPRGQYQLRVTGAELQGLGALQAAFERLKQKLRAEGLFALERKRPLPKYPQRIGLVTSPSGAAIRDVLHVVQRRNRALEILLVPCRVQGEGAADEIAAGIRLLNQFNRRQQALEAGPQIERRYLDLILITRGGGSLEDLWAFNEEVVARAIFESELPVVSGVGHEIDFTISDFVADVRAATPSAAAEIITEGVFSSCQFVADVAARIHQLAREQLLQKRDARAQLAQRFTRLHPRRSLNDQFQRIDDLQGSLTRCVKSGLRGSTVNWGHLAERLGRVRPEPVIKRRRQLVGQTSLRLREQARHRLTKFESRLGTLHDRLRLLGPEQVLSRGYSITLDAETGSLLRDAAEATKGQRLRTKLKSGEVISRVEK
jgi:exodeoxyribonuclease VII large subunit